MLLDLDTELLSLLPPWYAEILDYQEICKTEKAELESIANAIHQIADNFSPETMDLKAVEAWEKILTITANPQTEDLDFRRFRIRSRLSSVPPFTLPFLREKLDSIVGGGNYEIEIDYNNYTLYIDITAENANFYSEIAYTVNKMKPAHIVYRIAPSVVDAVIVSETVFVAEQQYNYILGAWGLGLQPFASASNQREVVTEDMQSVQPYLLYSSANHVLFDLAFVRINNDIIIGNLQKILEDNNTATITFSVIPTQAAEITKIETLTERYGILTASTVFIPVTEEITITHKIKFTRQVA